MTPEQERRLKTRFPLVFRALGRRRARSRRGLFGPVVAIPRIGFGTECGPGWYLLVATLARKLEKQIAGLPRSEQRRTYCVQVKEKFGGLRFYMNASTSAMDSGIAQAMERSFHVCEDCGRPAKLRKRAWLVTLCDEHARRRLAPEDVEREKRQQRFTRAARAVARARGRRRVRATSSVQAPGAY